MYALVRSAFCQSSSFAVVVT